MEIPVQMAACRVVRIPYREKTAVKRLAICALAFCSQAIGQGGIITTIAGGGSADPGNGGPATSVQFTGLQGVAVDAAGNLYFSDFEANRIFKLTPGGSLTTVAGNGNSGFSGDGGLATSAALSYPQGVAVDAAGNLYIADGGNGRIREVAGCVKASDVFPHRGGSISLDGWPTAMLATFEPTGRDGLPISLAAAAAGCGFNSFDWQQQITNDPDAAELDPTNGQLLIASTLAPNTPLQVPYFDPPPGGYTYQQQDPNLNDIPNAGAYPFYFSPEEPNTWISTPQQPYYPLSLQANETPPQNEAVCMTSVVPCLGFSDVPADPSFAPGNGKYLQFTTSLVGVVGDYPGAFAFPLYTWLWKSTFNGAIKNHGGVSIIRNNLFPAVPGSGTGGINIISINGVPISKGDINQDGTTNVADVQAIINEALGAVPAIDDLNGDGIVNVVDVQIVTYAVLRLGSAG